MTDERMGDALWAALARLPRGAGVVFRHYGSGPEERRQLFARVVRIARRRGLTVVRAGAVRLDGEDGRHNPPRRAGARRRKIITWSVHHRRDIVAARRAGVDLVFASPTFPTRSHPDARALGVLRLGLMVRDAGLPVVALGGMDARRFGRLCGLPLWGWAGIDAWTQPVLARSHGPVRAMSRPPVRPQKRKAVPT